MSLIDRDEMLSPKIWDMNIPNDVPKVVHDSLFELYNRLIHIPTVDAEPIRHGHWDSRQLVYECSECGFMGYSNMNYCPNCGAKMDAKGEEQ